MAEEPARNGSRSIGGASSPGYRRSGCRCRVHPVQGCTIGHLPLTESAARWSVLPVNTRRRRDGAAGTRAFHRPRPRLRNPGRSARDTLAAILRLWTSDAARFTQGEAALADTEPELAFRPARLTVTVGLGPAAFRSRRVGAPATALGGSSCLPSAPIGWTRNGAAVICYCRSAQTIQSSSLTPAGCC